MDFSRPGRKIGQGHPRDIISTNYDGLESKMLHTRFLINWPDGSGARFTKRFKTNFILSLNLGLISVKICLILKDVLTLS